MASSVGAKSRDVDDTHSRAIIRRFTGELTGATTLEQETKAAQVQQDEDQKAEAQQRMQQYYDNSAQYKFP